MLQRGMFEEKKHLILTEEALIQGEIIKFKKMCYK